MSHIQLRKEKNCLNCDNPNVVDRFCSKCGQENIESHLSVKNLVLHFFEDLTHYDNAFWKTIKYLLFHPAKLTIEYLSGKRKQFVAPIRLYFFISFITFFLPSVLPELDGGTENKSIVSAKSSKKENVANSNEGFSLLGSRNYKTVAQLDSIQNTLPESEKMNPLKLILLKKIVKANENKDKIELKKKFDESFDHNLPKAIFFYLPIFGFWLWLFHGKKRWLFFDHAVFTFHYFGFLLLTLTLSITFLERIYSLLPEGGLYDFISNFSGIITISWILIYFYIAHKRMYQETKWISFLKSTLFLILNISLVALVMIGFAIYSLISID